MPWPNTVISNAFMSWYFRLSIDDAELIGEKNGAICGGSFHIFIELRWTAGVYSSMC